MLFRLERKDDWTVKAHTAADKYELAVNRMSGTLTWDQMRTLATDIDIARVDLGRALLEIDRTRRPDFYLKGMVGTLQTHEASVP
jgi:hypothetical protein